MNSRHHALRSEQRLGSLLKWIKKTHIPLNHLQKKKEKGEERTGKSRQGTKVHGSDVEEA